MGCSPREIGWMYGQWKRLTSNAGGVLTGMGSVPLQPPPPPPLSHAAPIHVDSSRLHTCLLRELFKHINTRHLRACLLPTPHMPMIILVCCGNFQERSTSCRAYQALLTELHSMHKPGQVPAVWLIWQMHNKEAGICSLRIFPLWCDICQMSTAPSSCSG